MDVTPCNTVIRPGLDYNKSRVKLGASLGSSQMIHRLVKFQMYYERYNLIGNFYLAKTHLVSIFNDAGGKIGLLHIDVKTTKSEKIFTL